MIYLIPVAPSKSKGSVSINTKNQWWLSDSTVVTTVLQKKWSVAFLFKHCRPWEQNPTSTSIHQNYHKSDWRPPRPCNFRLKIPTPLIPFLTDSSRWPRWFASLVRIQPLLRRLDVWCLMCPPWKWTKVPMQREHFKRKWISFQPSIFRGVYMGHLFGIHVESALLMCKVSVRRKFFLMNKNHSLKLT